MSDTTGQQPPTESLIDYPDLVDQSLRNVVRLVLTKLLNEGLPGEHYFYIAFRTDHPEVDIDNELRAQHPDEMSIVLQYQYENLVVEDDHFEVTLYFGGKPKHLIVAYEAVTGFVDPYVSFALQFQPRGVPDLPEVGDEPEKVQTEIADSKDDTITVNEETGDDEVETADDGSNVVSLDAFRKK